MPGLNQSGPMGQGAMTGRKMGKCTNFAAKNQSANAENGSDNTAVAGRGMGRGLGKGQAGMGMGMGRRKQNGNRNNDTNCRH